MYKTIATLRIVIETEHEDSGEEIAQEIASMTEAMYSENIIDPIVVEIE